MKSLSNKELIIRILFIFLISRAVMVAAYYVYAAITKDHSGFEIIFGRWDAIYYKELVTDGYQLAQGANAQANYAFFPLYILICKGIYLLTFRMIPAFYICVGVSNFCIILASFFGVKLIRKMGIIRRERVRINEYLLYDGLILVWLLMLGPFTVYFATAYTESLFVLLVVLTFYFLKDRKFLLAGMFAALAGATRSPGCLLVLPVVMEMWKANRDEKLYSNIVAAIFRQPKWLLSILIVPSGVFAFMVYLYNLTGDAWAFKNIQAAWRTNEEIPIAGVLIKALSGQWGPEKLVMGCICIAAVIIFIYMIVKGFAGEGVFGLAVLITALTSDVLSTPRFIAGSFVIWIGVYYIISRMRPALRNLTMGLLIASECILIAAWVAWAQFMM